MHSRGGVCSLHGPGAKYRWRPKGENRIVVDANGRKKTTFDKEYFWACDLAPSGGKKLTQTRLSFKKTPSRSQGDTNRAASLILSSPYNENVTQKNMKIQTPSVGTKDRWV